MLPFLSQDTLEALADRLDLDDDIEMLADLAPFLSQETLNNALNATNSRLPIRFAPNAVTITALR